MKKKLLAMLTLLSLCVATLVSAVVISAAEPLTFGVMTTDSQIATVSDATEGGKGKVTFTEAGSASLSIPVSNLDLSVHTQLSVKVAMTGITSFESYVYGNGANGETTYIVGNMLGGWNITSVDYDDFSIITAKIDSYYSLDSITSVSQIVFSINAESADATFEVLDIALTSDGNHGFEVPALPMSISDMRAPGANATYTKTQDGDQIITYSVSPGWENAKMTVTGYDPTKSVFRIEFTCTKATYLCFSINGEHDGHREYPAGKRITVEKDVSANSAYGIATLSSFDIRIYFDAEQTVTEEKSVTFHSVSFVEPTPEPTGMYIAAPKATAMTVSSNGDGTYDASWTGKSWQNVSFDIKNHEIAYDILKVVINATKDTNIGIRWFYQVSDGTDVVETYVTARNHDDANDGIVKETGDLELIYHAEAFGIQGAILTKVEIWFDAANNTSINEDGGSATIKAVELYKSSDITFKPLTITANEMTADYNGEPIAYTAAQPSANAPIVVKYAAEGTDKWTTSAPTDAGVYNVQVICMGTLEYDYQAVTSKLTINKVKAVVNADDVTVDATTRIVTVAEGVIASTDADFTEGFEVEDGDEIEGYGTVIYYKRPADNNYNESDVLSLTVTRPTENPGESTGGTTSEPNGESTTGTNGGSSSNGGCKGSIALGAEMTLALFGAAVAIRRKRR